MQSACSRATHERAPTRRERQRSAQRSRGRKHTNMSAHATNSKLVPSMAIHPVGHTPRACTRNNTTGACKQEQTKSITNPRTRATSRDKKLLPNCEMILIRTLPLNLHTCRHVLSQHRDILAKTLRAPPPSPTPVPRDPPLHTPRGAPASTRKKRRSLYFVHAVSSPPHQIPPCSITQRAGETKNK